MKKTIILLFAVLSSVNLISQNLNGLTFNLPHNIFVEKGIENGAFIISHSYQLCDTASSQRFGRYGNPEFGSNYSIAIKVKGGYIIPKAVLTPWLFDDNFSRYQDNYKPVSYKIKYKNLSDSVKQELNNDVFSSIQKINGVDFCLVKDTSSFNGDGFMPDVEGGVKEGWCVWYVASSSAESFDSLGLITTITLRHDMEITPDVNHYEIETPNTVDTFIGGIYLVPVQTSIGVMSLKLSGIITKEGDVWQILTPFVDYNIGDELFLVSSQNEVISSEPVLSEDNGDTSNQPSRRRRNRR